jgi:hypothetical protein
MKTFIAAAALAMAFAGQALAQPAPAAPAAPAAAKPAAGKLTSDSTIAAIVANEKGRAILEKHLPVIVEYADMIPEGTTLKQLSQMDEAKAIVTPELVKAVEDDLAKL